LAPKPADRPELEARRILLHSAEAEDISARTFDHREIARRQALIVELPLRGFPGDERHVAAHSCAKTKGPDGLLHESVQG
jgi:hypothetical protein